MLRIQSFGILKDPSIKGIGLIENWQILNMGVIFIQGLRIILKISSLIRVVLPLSFARSLFN